MTPFAVVSRSPFKVDIGCQLFIFPLWCFRLYLMIEILGTLLAGSSVSECSASGVQERKRASDEIMLKFKGSLASKWRVTLRVEASVAGHLKNL